MTNHLVGNFPLSSSRFLRAEASLGLRMGELPLLSRPDSQ
jgi:hypothetical protein